MYTAWMYCIYGINVLYIRHECIIYTAWMYCIYGINVLYIRHKCPVYTAWMYCIYGMNVLYIWHECIVYTAWMYCIYGMNVLYIWHKCIVYRAWMQRRTTFIAFSSDFSLYRTAELKLLHRIFFVFSAALHNGFQSSFYQKFFPSYQASARS